MPAGEDSIRTPFQQAAHAYMKKNPHILIESENTVRSSTTLVAQNEINISVLKWFFVVKYVFKHLSSILNNEEIRIDALALIFST